MPEGGRGEAGWGPQAEPPGRAPPEHGVQSEGRLCCIKREGTPGAPRPSPAPIQGSCPSILLRDG